ncbi:Serine-threonin protein phosphatase [Novymonas esmeraldas]|uniref:Serine-threonin protein phosphatase n=1 Tax=Novymonas esmeraldas TaxID=1808958 RepID=A0AAW0EPE6_9TRYP
MSWSLGAAHVATLFLVSFLLLSAGGVRGGRDVVEIHRIVAIGDIHGDVKNFLKILRIADLIEDSAPRSSDVLNNPPRWKHSISPTGGAVVRTTLVQMGDLVDRGKEDLQVLNVAMALQEQTAQSGSLDKVVLLIGNHELLNLQGHMHYVHKDDYGGFVSRALRVEGMQSTGAFGKYIVDNFKAAHLDEGVLFVHAGIETEMDIKDVESLNVDVRGALRENSFRHPALGSRGPLWTRKMISESMMDDCAGVQKILTRLKASRVVVGHTPQESGRVERYCNGRVFAIDVGLSRWMYNHIAALEFVFTTHRDTITDLSSTELVISELRKTASGVTRTVLQRTDAVKSEEYGGDVAGDDLDGDL